MLSVVQDKMKEGGWENVEIDVLDVRELKSLKDDTFSYVIYEFWGFAECGGRGGAVEEMYRVLKKGGIADVST
jgi:ubiquinone/menaquinone biosynthesis C-methylase UbiE